jgi:hypothetical protein
LCKQKVAQKGAIILGYFIFSKNHNEPPEVAQLAKKLHNLVSLNVNSRNFGSWNWHYSIQPSVMAKHSAAREQLEEI